MSAAGQLYPAAAVYRFKYYFFAGAAGVAGTAFVVAFAGATVFAFLLCFFTFAGAVVEAGLEEFAAGAGVLPVCAAINAVPATNKVVIRVFIKVVLLKGANNPLCRPFAFHSRRRPSCSRLHSYGRSPGCGGS